MWNMMPGSNVQMLWMLAGQVVIWVAVIVGVVLIARMVAEALRERRDTPLALLQRRLASGEISREEYESVRRILAEPLDASRSQPTPPRIAP